MSKGERIVAIASRLEAWAARLAEFDRQMDAYAALTRAQPDSPLLDAIYRLEEAYTMAVAEQVGDTGGWLMWFRWECEMGKKPLEARRHASASFAKVRTVRQLARLVAA